jgi:hypothetical protein
MLIAALLIAQIASAQSAGKKKTTNNPYAKTQLQEALNNKLQQQVTVDTVIADKETAIKVAEVILFKAYGKDEIRAERPYLVDYINGYWILNGTLPTEWTSGTFLIIIRAKDGQVIKLTHGK